MPTTRAQSVRSSSRTASPEFHSSNEHSGSQQPSASTPLSSRNLRSSGHPAEHVDVDHIDVAHLSREARALLEDDLAHIPGSQGSPRLPHSTRSASLTPSRSSARDTSKARRSKSSAARRIEDVSVTEDEDSHYTELLLDFAHPEPSTSRDIRDGDSVAPGAAIEVEAWRENLNPVNAHLVDIEETRESEEPEVQAAQDVDAETDSSSDSGSDTSTASDATATPRRFASSAATRLDEEEDDEDLDDLFQRALAKARQAQAVDAAGLQDELQADVMMVGEKTVKERPIPGLTVPSIPVHSLDLSTSKTHQRASNKNSSAAEDDRRSDRAEGSRPSGSKLQHGLDGKSKEPEKDDSVYQPELTRKQKMKQPQTQSANEAWAALPTIPSALLPQMKRDYQAMNLANSLDPKRFMKGGAKSAKIPESFAIGTIINPPKRLQSTTLAKERKYNPGSIVQGLVANSDLNSYAKRKYDEFSSTRMANGRGKGWKKRKEGDW